MGQLPVEHGPQPVGADDHVAETEVAVHDHACRLAAGRLASSHRSASSNVGCGSPEGVEQSGDTSSTWSVSTRPGTRRRIDGVDPDQRVGELLGQRSSGACDTRRRGGSCGRRLALDRVMIMYARTQVGAIRRRRHELAVGTPALPTRRGPRPPRSPCRAVAVALTLEDQRAAVGLESPGVARSTTRQSGQIGDLGSTRGRLASPSTRSSAISANEGQWARTVGYGLTAGPPPGGSRSGGAAMLNCAFPVWPR